jgi:hypothetical protein
MADSGSSIIGGVAADGAGSWLGDVSPASRIESRLRDRLEDFGSIIPSGYAAYGRLFHPVEATEGYRRWADVARENSAVGRSRRPWSDAASAEPRLPGRGRHPHRHRAARATRSFWEDQSPTLWWPDDRAWFVATDIDYPWTYIGGSTELIDEPLADDRLEVLPARLTDKPFHDSDTVNARLDDRGGQP